ncbi:hypothetical protein ACFQ2M_42600 [Kitasatospora saccharophila]|uniref:hypothetical protein n=1 Tax=Kitasatospora saccharophila TaxID=407973 RepID=UPI0036311550
MPDRHRRPLRVRGEGRHPPRLAGGRADLLAGLRHLHGRHRGRPGTGRDRGRERGGARRRPRRPRRAHGPGPDPPGPVLGGVPEFCRVFKAKDTDTWYPENYLGLALAEADGRWILATESNDCANLSYTLYDDEARARAAFAHGIVAYYWQPQDRAYHWTSLDRTENVLAAPTEPGSSTYAVVAAFGDHEHELATVEGRDAARTRAAGFLAAHFHRLPPVTDTADTEALIRYQALRRTVMSDEVANSEAVLGDAIRRADAQELYGHGRGRTTWTELADHLGVARDTVTEIRKGRAW